MNIAHLLPYSARFPLTKHNGRYEWALRLARIQASQGHTVTIYAAPGSHDPASTLRWASHGTTTLGDMAVNNLANIVYALQSEHGIYHSHFDYAHYLVADMTRKSIVATQHWFPNNVIAHATIFNKHRNVLAVPVTSFMASADKRLGILASHVISHGIDLNLFRPVPQPKNDRYIFVGRITPGKGVREAVAIAKAAGVALDIIGKVNAVDEAYWQTVLTDVDGKQIRYLGAKSQAELAEHLATAKAMLFPVQAAEAFGQTIIEAQACGTPVIIQARDAASELVQNGVTGFLASTAESYLAAIRRIDTISPAKCRNFAEQFDIRAMVNNYASLYEQLQQ